MTIELVIARENFTEPLVVDANLKGETRWPVSRPTIKALPIASTAAAHSTPSHVPSPPFKDSLAPIRR